MGVIIAAVLIVSALLTSGKAQQPSADFILNAELKKGSEINCDRALIFSDTNVIPQILALPLASHIGKPVDSLFSSLPTGYTSRGFIPYGIGYAKGVYQSYGILETNNCSVQIFIDNFHHLLFPNRTKTTNWDMGLAKKEIISYIKVFKNNECVYYCTNANYYD